MKKAPIVLIGFALIAIGPLLLLAQTTTGSDSTALPPVISNIRAENIMGPGVQIIWITDIPSDSRVMYGTTPGYYSGFSDYRCDGGGFATNHCINLTGLSYNTLYYYKVGSVSSHGAGSYSSEYSFTSATSPYSNQTYSTTTSTESTDTSTTSSTTSLGDHTVPLAPTNLSGTLLSNGADALISWTDNATNETEYRLYFRPLYGTWGHFSITVNTTSYTYYNQPAGTYEYSVGACNSYGCSGYASSSVFVTRGGSTAPSSETTTSTTTGATDTITASEPQKVSFSVTVGNRFCGTNQWETLAPVTFRVSPFEGGAFFLKGSKDLATSTSPYQDGYDTNMGIVWWSVSQTLPADSWYWEGHARPGFTGSGRGDFIIEPLADCKPTLNTAPLPPVSITNVEDSEKMRELYEKKMPQGAVIPLLPSAITQATYSHPPLLEGRVVGVKEKTPSTDAPIANFRERISQSAELIEMKRVSAQPETRSDSDGDGISDYDEINIYGTGLNSADTDKDGTSDGEEILRGTQPLIAHNDQAPERQLVLYEGPKELIHITVGVDQAAGTSTTLTDLLIVEEIFTVEKIAVASTTVKSDGTEIVSAVHLEGKALPNSFVTLYIYSTSIVVTVKTDHDGKWTYTLEKELEDGKHEVYVAMTDGNGKILASSNPIPFVKEALAVSLESNLAVSAEAESGEKFFNPGMLLMFSAFLVLIITGAIAVLGFRRNTPPGGGITPATP